MGKLSDFENTSFNSFEIIGVSESDDSDPVTNFLMRRTLTTLRHSLFVDGLLIMKYEIS